MDDRKRILFVEDDPLLLEQLRESMRDVERDWDLAFVASGEQAMQAFERGPLDAVVTDLGLPGISGVEVLESLRSRHPGALRFVLSGTEDPELRAGMIARAHQYLRKPCSPTFLKSVLRRSFQLAERVHNPQARELVARIGQLPSVPSLYQEITRLMASEHATTERLAEAIRRDPAMTAMVLKLANSAFFSPRTEVTDATSAVAILGMDLLRSLVLAHGLFSQAGAFRLATFSLAHLWRHSLAVAAGAQAIAVQEGLGRAAAAEHFTAGLLHDAGVLVLASRFPDDYRRVIETCREAGCDLETAEYHVLGAGHGEVGAFLLGLWGLPPQVVQAVGWHHQPHRADAVRFGMVTSVHAADALLASDPEHEVFSHSRLDLEHLAGLGLADRIEAWQGALHHPDATGLHEIF